MFKTGTSFLPDDDPSDIDYGIEYNVYDVTPDVSIDFVSFTTEESEGEAGSVEYLSTINQFALLLQAFQAPLICIVSVVRSVSALSRHRRIDAETQLRHLSDFHNR